jgi:hypothetical protein
MASCTKCGANLIAQARFCASCGSPVTSSSVIPPPSGRKSAGPSAPDPFARTILSDGLADAPAEAPPVAVSPMAASVMAAQGQVPNQRPAPAPATPPLPQAQAPAPQPQAPIPTPAVPSGAASYPPAAAQQSHAFAPGTLVLVYWADGNRYPGTILQISQHHVYVAFPNGMQQWIDARYVQAGS